eukprot:m.22319 g.22319  ORF g.22319 m.22319 type:complete len:498 (+) comp7387_c0_seq2:235-1728(+)
MEKYENMGVIGEGSYGLVLKCKHKESGDLVAIKRFLESDEDKQVKKIAMREIRMLKQLRHENLVNLIEVFRRKRRLYLVFEYVDHTLLHDLEANPNGLSVRQTRLYLWQIVQAVRFCHSQNVLHRDIKPENVLVTKHFIIKLCDFGFARTIASQGEAYTDYVATRWYRAPELLVGDVNYGMPVDVWAIGCLLAEMLTGDPLFPGDSDVDQLYHIVRCMGKLTRAHEKVFLQNKLFVGIRLPEARELVPLKRKLRMLNSKCLEVVEACLQLIPEKRDTCEDLLQHSFFVGDGLDLAEEVKARIRKDKGHKGKDKRRRTDRERDRERDKTRDHYESHTLEALNDTTIIHTTNNHMDGGDLPSLPSSRHGHSPNGDTGPESVNMGQHINTNKIKARLSSARGGGSAELSRAAIVKQQKSGADNGSEPVPTTKSKHFSLPHLGIGGGPGGKFSTGQTGAPSMKSKHVSSFTSKGATNNSSNLSRKMQPKPQQLLPLPRPER